MQTRLSKKYETPVSLNNEAMISELLARGKCDWVDVGVTDEHFPHRGARATTVPIQLVQPGRLFSTGEVLAIMTDHNLYPVAASELIALYYCHPEIQGASFPIAALGQTWHCSFNHRYVVSIVRNGCERGIGLDRARRGWPSIYQFAAVSK